MKKLVALALVMALSFTMAINSEAKSDNSNGNSKDTTLKSNNVNTQTQKVFKAELNDQKKSAINERTALNKEKGILEAEYEALMTAGDITGATAKLAEINDLTAQLNECQVKIKEANNERYMIVKTMYSEEELAAFENAGAAIDAMYADAAIYILGAGCIMANDEVIKFDTPPYIKGGVTLVPVSAITEQLGAQVNWDEETQTVSITKDGILITMTIGSNIVTVSDTPAALEEETTHNGTTTSKTDSTIVENNVDIDVAAEITNGRTYVPLRFLAETFGLAVAWDGENKTIDIDEQVGNTCETEGQDTVQETSPAA